MNEDLSNAILETVAETMGLSEPSKDYDRGLFNTLCAYCNWKLIFEEEWDWPRGRRTANSFDRWNLED